jgi:hypothetical protein
MTGITSERPMIFAWQRPQRGQTSVSARGSDDARGRRA